MDGIRCSDPRSILRQPEVITSFQPRINVVKRISSLNSTVLKTRPTEIKIRGESRRLEYAPSVKTIPSVKLSKTHTPAEMINIHVDCKRLKEANTSAISKEVHSLFEVVGASPLRNLEPVSLLNRNGVIAEKVPVGVVETKVCPPAIAKPSIVEDSPLITTGDSELKILSAQSISSFNDDTTTTTSFDPAPASDDGGIAVTLINEADLPPEIKATMATQSTSSCPDVERTPTRVFVSPSGSNALKLASTSDNCASVDHASTCDRKASVASSIVISPTSPSVASEKIAAARRKRTVVMLHDPIMQDLSNTDFPQLSHLVRDPSSSATRMMSIVSKSTNTIVLLNKNTMSSNAGLQTAIAGVRTPFFVRKVPKRNAETQTDDPNALSACGTCLDLQRTINGNKVTINMLVREVARLKQTSNAMQGCESQSLLKQKEKIRQNMNEVFTPQQTEILISGLNCTQVKWNSASCERAEDLLNDFGKSGYCLLRDRYMIPLPSLGYLQTHRPENASSSVHSNDDAASDTMGDSLTQFAIDEDAADAMKSINESNETAKKDTDQSVSNEELDWSMDCFDLQELSESTQNELSDTRGIELSQNARRELIRFIARTMIQRSIRCERRDCCAVVDCILKKFPHLTLDGTTSTRETFLLSLYNSMLLLRRGANPDGFKRRPVGVGYGCVNWTVPFAASPTDYESMRSTLQERWQAREETRGTIDDKEDKRIRLLLRKCFPYQRAEFNKCARKNVRFGIAECIARWPFLFEAPYYDEHCSILIGFDVRKTTKAFVESAKMIRLLSFLEDRCSFNEVRYHQGVGVSSKEIEKRYSDLSNPSLNDKLVRIVMLLLRIFKESSFEILRQSKDEGETDENLTWSDSFSAPRIIYQGSEVYGCKWFSIVMGDVRLFEGTTSFCDALASLIMLYFMCGLRYPINASMTLDFCQRVITGINPKELGHRCTLGQSKRRAHPSNLHSIRLYDNMRRHFVTKGYPYVPSIVAAEVSVSKPALAMLAQEKVAVLEPVKSEMRAPVRLITVLTPQEKRERPMMQCSNKNVSVVVKRRAPPPVENEDIDDVDDDDEVQEGHPMERLSVSEIMAWEDVLEVPRGTLREFSGMPSGVGPPPRKVVHFQIVSSAT